MNNRQSGVTLIELMIVVVVVSILAAIAIPSYRQYAIRTNRTEGKVALEQRVQALEKCFTRYMRYDDPNCAAASATAVTTPNGHYSVVTTTPNPNQFTVTATPQGGQVADTKCMNLSISETSARGITGTGPATSCW